MEAIPSDPESSRSSGRYILARIIVGFGLLVAATIILALRWDQPAQVEMMKTQLGLTAGLFAVMAISAATLRRWGHLPAFVWAQLVGDAIFATLLVSLTGGPVSFLLPLYFINILGAAWLLPSPAPVLVAGLDAVAFVGLLLVRGEPWVAQVSGGPITIVTYTQVLVQLFAFFLVGLLSNTLSERIRSARQALAQRVQRAEALEEQHQLVLDQLEGGVVIFDRAGLIQEVNPAARRLLGEVEGQALREVLRTDAPHWEETLSREGAVIHLLCRRNTLRDGGGVVLLDDVSKLREMEALIAREERLSAVGRLAAGLAHEIRNPLASISGSIQLLREEHQSPLYNIVVREVTRLNELVEDFLDSARPVRLDLRQGDLGTLVGEVVTTFRNDPRYQGRRVLRTRIRSLEPIEMDPARIRQLLWNLILNAAQATPEYGTIEISAQPDAVGRLVEIKVSDDGVGIPPEALRRIFDPFYTTRSGGTGLGLANVERVVRAHGGTIQVESVPNQGTTFTIRLPRKGPPDEPPEEGAHVRG